MGDMFLTFDISSSALSAERKRMNVIANNIANINTMSTPAGEKIPYSRKAVFFKQGAPQFTRSREFGVMLEKIMSDRPRFRVLKQDADDPRAITAADVEKYKDKYPELANHVGDVLAPNVNLVAEMVDMIEASRAYQANITVMDVTKNMMSDTLRLLV